MSNPARDQLDRSGIAYYRQIADVLIGRIYSGSYGPGERLPSDRELGDEFGHNRHTVRRALDRVEERQLITRQQGRGTYVVEDLPERPAKTQLPVGLIDVTRGIGTRPTAEVLKVSVQAANEAALPLRMDRDDDVIYLHRIRLIGGEPVIVEHVYFPRSLCPGLEKYDLRRSVRTLLSDQFNLDVARKEIAFESVLSNGYVSQLLDIAVGSPLMLEKRITYTSGDMPCEYAEHIYRGDRFSFVFE